MSGTGARGGARGVALLLAASVAAHAAKPERGAYCPIPEPGETPECLLEAKANYSDFFANLETGGPSKQAARRIESDLAGASGVRAYQALSSLAYGYYRLAERAAGSKHVDPEIAERLQRWNGILSQAFAASDAEPHFREAVREAAYDIHRRAPPVKFQCLDENGQSAECDATAALLLLADTTRDDTGVRGQLGRLFDRIFGEDGP